MTINIALATSEGLVLGCDSIASSIEYVVDPFELSQPKDEQGNPLADEDGRPLISLDLTSIRPVVTNAWGGVTKLFQIHEGKTSVAAVTAGIARLNNRTMKSYAEEFLGLQERRRQPYGDVLDVSTAYLQFMREHFLEHYQGSLLPEDYWNGPNFLVGGYGASDELPSIYRLDIKANKVYKHFTMGSFGVTWDGQADSVERLIRGYDSALKDAVEKHLKKVIDGHYQEITDAMAKILEEVLAKLDTELPSAANTVLPSKLDVVLPWDEMETEFDYGNLPLQSAVDFVAFLVNLQSGMSRFSPGVATVGGRTHIAVITRGEGFSTLNEPELQHRHTGFGDDV